MKSGIKILSFAFIFVSSNLFAIDLAKWKYHSGISLDAGPAEHYKLDITPQVYDVAKSDLSDIRIIDANGAQVPYIIARPHDITSSREFSPNIINRSTNSQNDSLVTLDFGSQMMKNSIKIITDGSNFRRAVKIEGSNDNINFLTVVNQAFVFAVQDKKWSRFSDVDLPANDYRYLRITVSPMHDEQNSPRIEDVRVFISENKPAPRTTVAVANINHIENEKENVSVYEYDLGFKNLPLSEIQLSIDDKSFYRQITVEGRNVLKRRIKIASEDNRERFEDVNESWNNVTGGTIYRYVSADGREHQNAKLSISSGDGTYRYLRLTIRNYDDKSLKLLSAWTEMIPHRIIFTVEDNVKPLSLYIGFESASRPQYDIVHKLSNPLEVSALPAIAEMITENPLFGKSDPKPVPWTEKHKTPLLIVLITAVLLVGLYMLKSFKSIKPNPSE